MRPCGRWRRNRRGRCAGGLGPSGSSLGGPTPAQAGPAATRSARTCVAVRRARARVHAHARPHRAPSHGHGGGDDGEATETP
jgi:hypothetical protein